MTAYAHFDYYLRSTVTALLALGVLGVASYQYLAHGTLSGPFDQWAGLILGVYFGSHISLNGSGTRKAVAQHEAATAAADQRPPG